VGFLTLRVSQIDKHLHNSHAKWPKEPREPGISTWEKEDGLGDSQGMDAAAQPQGRGPDGIPEPLKRWCPGAGGQPAMLLQA